MNVTNRIPLDIGPIHFVGIGGIGMSGIARVMQASGYVVRGSDIATGGMVEQLKSEGIEIFEGHDAAHIEGAAIVVHSTAIPRDNVEILAAAGAGIPIVHRAEMLGEIVRLAWSVMVSGTHGKTTITSMLGEIFIAAQLDPTVISGGIIRTFGSNARVGRGKWVVVEADESDGSMLRLPGIIAVITSIDAEHLDYWGSFDAMFEGYHRMVANLPFYGFAAMCCDHPQVRRLAQTVKERRCVTYGLSEDANVRAINIRTNNKGTMVDVVLNHPLHSEQKMRDLCIPLYGRHNIENALAAVAVASEVGIPLATIRSALEHFSGVERRLTDLGLHKGVRVVDDYAHHPAEIRASIDGSRSAIMAGAWSSDPLSTRLIIVVEPHRYTRLRDLFQEFARAFVGADLVFVAPVYAAGEPAISGIDAASIAQAITETSKVKAVAIDNLEEGLKRVINEVARPGDMVLAQGPGKISTVLRKMCTAWGMQKKPEKQSTTTF